MNEDDFVDLLDKVLEDPARTLGSGVARARPAVEVLRYYVRSIRLGPLPFFGKGLSLVALVRLPDDLLGTKGRHRALLRRVAEVSNARYPPRRAFSIALSVVIVTPEPIVPDDDLRLADELRDEPRLRCVSLGLFLMNLKDETMAFAIRKNSEGLLGEPAQLVDALTPRFRQFVPLPKWD